jgi:hypothetical protein
VDENVRFQQLLEYKKDFGDCRLPRGFRRNSQLGNWTHTQRRANKEKRMTKERWEKLNSIRFDWGEEPSSHEKYQRTIVGLCDDVPEKAVFAHPKANG